MELYNIKKNKVSQIETTPFNLEKDIQKLVEDNTQEIFNLDFVSSEFSLNEFRIDHQKATQPALSVCERPKSHRTEHD